MSQRHPDRLSPALPRPVPDPAERGVAGPAAAATRWAGPISIIAAALMVLSQLARLRMGLLLGADSATTVAHSLTYSLALLGMYALVLALTAVYASESAALGRLGLVGYLIALLGTLLVAGDWWFEAFVVPMIAEEAPGVLDLAPGASGRRFVKYSRSRTDGEG